MVFTSLSCVRLKALMVFTSLSGVRLKALMVFTSLSCAMSQCLGAATSIHLQMLFSTDTDYHTVADSSVFVCVISMKGIVKKVWFVCMCLQIKSSSNNKGPYDFSQPNLLQELNGEHTVSLPPVCSICLLNTVAKTS